MKQLVLVACGMATVMCIHQFKCSRFSAHVTGGLLHELTIDLISKSIIILGRLEKIKLMRNKRLSYI